MHPGASRATSPDRKPAASPRLPRLPRRAACGWALLALLLPAAPAGAATARGFAVDRYSPSGGGSDWFALESLDFRGHFRPSGGLTLNYADQPLAVHDTAGNEYGNAIVDSQLFVHAGLAMMWRDRVRASLSFPLAVHQAGNEQVVGDFYFRSADRVAAGDLRLGGDVLLLGAYQDRLQVAAGIELILPTGVRSQYTSDGVVRVAPRVLAAGQWGRYVYAARLGFHTRGGVPEPQREIVRIGHEVTGGLALGVRPAPEFVVGLELYGATAVTGGNYLRESVSPLELLFSARFKPAQQFHVMLGVAPGITSAVGSPTIRVLGRVEYAPATSLF